MKKTLPILLVITLLFSLCACNNNDSHITDPSNSIQATTNSTEASTDGTEKPTDGTEETIGTTQAPTETPTTAPTEEPTVAPTNEPTIAPTDEPTTPPIQAPTETPTAPPATEPAPTTPVHTHTWTDATCTAPKTCNTCGATEGSAKDHAWNAATCTTPKTCTTCGATEGGLADHNYTNGACSACGVASPTEPPKATKTVYLLTSRKFTLHDSDGWDQTTNFYYNADGFLARIEEISTAIGTETDEVTVYTVTEHTTEGLPTKIESQKGITTYEYDDMGHIIKQTGPAGYLMPSGCSKIERTYDETGFLLHEIRTRVDGSIETWTYEKNGKGHIAKQEQVVDRGNGWIYGCTSTISYTYDATGRVLRQDVSEEGDNGVYGYRFTHCFNYSYDASGSQVKVEHLMAEPQMEDWLESSTTFSYDSAGNLIHEVCNNYSIQPNEIDEYTYTYQAIQVPVDSTLDQLDVLVYAPACDSSNEFRDYIIID